MDKSFSASSKRLDHHGIVAGVIKDIGLIQAVDEIIPSYGGEVVSEGQAVAAMIINGLGFTDQALSLTEEFFEELPTERLLGEGVTSDTLNKNKLSRALDRVYEAGCSSFFSKLASQAILQEGIDAKVQSLDSTSFSLTGDYDRESDTQAIEVKRGFSKDHRPDLKQVIAEMMVSHDGDVPLILKMHDGNKNDSTLFKERCDELVKQFDGTQLLVADSKLYSKNNATNLDRIQFVTRIPESINEAKLTIVDAVSQFEEWVDPDLKLSFKTYEKSHYGIRQNWMVCCSEESVNRATSTIERRVKKELESVEKVLFHLQAKRFSCRADAEAAYEAVGKKLKFHRLGTGMITEHKHFSGRGKPKKDATPTEIKIQIGGFLVPNTKDMERAIRQHACFIIATNSLRSDPGEVIDAYKKQASVERGFRFLKDPTFFAQSFYLKKPERIEALVTVMTLSLLVYTIAQRRIRAALAEEPPFVPNSSKKPYKNPTLKRIFQLFRGINEITLAIEQTIHRTLDGIKELHLRILNALGGSALSLYSD